MAARRHRPGGGRRAPHVAGERSPRPSSGSGAGARPTLRATELARREATARCRARQAATGLTFDEFLRRSPVGDPELLRRVLNDEVRRGRVVYHSTSRRYVLNGHLPDDVKLALRDLLL